MLRFTAESSVMGCAWNRPKPTKCRFVLPFRRCNPAHSFHAESSVSAQRSAVRVSFHCAFNKVNGHLTKRRIRIFFLIFPRLTSVINSFVWCTFTHSFLCYFHCRILRISQALARKFFTEICRTIRH